MRKDLLLADVRKYVEVARRAWARWKEGDDLAREALAMALFQVANSIIAMGEDAHRARNLGIPPTYFAIFEDLKNAGVISEDDLNVVDLLIRLRNRIAHRYGHVSDRDAETLYALLPAAERIAEKLGN